MGWFTEDKPKTGSGTQQPAGTRALGRIHVIFRQPDGTVVRYPPASGYRTQTPGRGSHTPGRRALVKTPIGVGW
jgi:hypothetical protein